MEMTKYRLGDIAKIFDGPHATPRKTESGPIYLGVDAITEDCKINPSEFAYLSENDYKIWTKRVVPQHKDIVFSYEATLGRYAIIPEDFYGCLGRRLGLVRIIDDRVDYKWLYYFFQSPQWTNFIKSHTIKGSTVNRISVDEMPSYEIPCVAMSEQRKIASVLSALDDKIALNKKMNQKLEAMAKRLYDYWFVQFDFPDENGRPYKTSGGPMTHNETLNREIPEGWEVKCVNDVTSSVRGVSYSSDDEKKSTDTNVIQILRGNNISGSRFVFDSNEVFVSADLVQNEQKISKYDIVMTMSSGSKEHVGKSALALFDMPHSFGAFCSKFTPNENARYFIDCYLHSEFFIKYIRQTCSGTGINNLTNGHFDKAMFAWPSKKILDQFNEMLNAVYERRGVVEREISRLTALRDKLLPLLMNGQVIVD